MAKQPVARGWRDEHIEFIIAHPWHVPFSLIAESFNNHFTDFKINKIQVEFIWTRTKRTEGKEYPPPNLNRAIEYNKMGQRIKYDARKQNPIPVITVTQPDEEDWVLVE